MIKEAIQKIEEMVKEKLTVDVGGMTYSASNLKPVLFEPRPATITVHNLRGFCGFITNDIDKRIKNFPMLIVVDSPEQVTLLSEVKGDNLAREILIQAVLDNKLAEFPFGTFMSQEEFAIQFRSLFVQKPNDDFDYVLSYTSKLVASTSVEGEDDGITQRVQIKKGASGVRVEGATLKPIVNLSPYRTFREIEQVESQFLFRVRVGNDGIPLVALFEADGGAWVNEATERCVNYIKSMVSDIPVIA